jgi:hypothetical protein
MAHENLFKIHIPEPCHQDWGKMTLNEQGAFCKVCAKTVIDFTGRSESEIQQYIVENIDKKICGRFNVSQIEREEIPKLKVNIEEPKYNFPGFLLPLLTPFRVSALALMLAASAMLSSCGNTGYAGGDHYPLTGAVVMMDSTDKPVNIKTDSTDSVPKEHNIQGGISINNARSLRYLTDSSDVKNTKTIGKIRIEQDTIKADTTTSIKGEIEPRVKMGMIKRLPEEKK